VFGRLDEAIRYENEAIALDPLAPRGQIQLGAMLIGAERFDDFQNDPILKKTLGSDPRYQVFIRKMNFPK
jgi:hypothetical protein